MAGVQDLAELLTVIEEFAPLVEKATPIVQKIGTDLKPILVSLVDNQVEMTDRAITAYKKLGYSKKEAMTLTMYNKLTVLEAFNKNR